MSKEMSIAERNIWQKCLVIAREQAAQEVEKSMEVDFYQHPARYRAGEYDSEWAVSTFATVARAAYADMDKRVSELLEVANREVERRRVAERKLREHGLM